MRKRRAILVLVSLTLVHCRREEYVAGFLAHVDWEEVARRYRAVDRK